MSVLLTRRIRNGRIEAILNVYRAGHVASVDAIDAVQSALVKLKNRG